MSTEKSVELPVKRTTGETLKDRMTDNAYERILPARYLRQDENGEIVESQEELFERVAKNVALAEAVYAAESEGEAVLVEPSDVKPGHSNRDELVEEVFGEGVTLEDDVKIELTEENVSKFAYDTVVPKLDGAVRDAVVERHEEFQEAMERLSFIPNSPTLMNAGDELQQLSACFVDSPEDDMQDIHETAKEAAEVFQCLTDDARVRVEDKGIVSVADVEPGDRIVQRDGDQHTTRNVKEVHAYDDAPVRRLVTEAGIEITGTPNHELLVDGEWTRIDETEAGDSLALRLGWLNDERDEVELEKVETGALWGENRTVSNEDIAELHSEGLSDYEIAEVLGTSSSTVQRRRSIELGLDPNGSGGRTEGDVSFDADELESLYTDGRTDTEIADELGVSTRAVVRYRERHSLVSNGRAVKTVRQPERLTPELAEIVGLWVGDGSKHQDGIRFHFAREETLEHADRLCRELFDEGLDWRWEDGCYDAVLHSHEVKRWWLANFGDAKPDAPKANVPEPVWRADAETVAAFLRGLFTADGSLQKDLYPRLWSSSKRLIDEVQQLLLGIGIPATEWEYDTDERDYYNIGPTGERGLETFIENIGFVGSRAEKMRDEFESVENEGSSVGSIEGSTWHIPVESIEDAGTNTVYDVTVADEPEYVANSVVSHNSGGGMGYAFWKLRPYGDPVGSTGGIASGPITFMRTFDQMCETIAQGGTRRGAQMGVMRVSHPDVIQFIHAKNKDVSLAHSLRLNDPDDYTHTSFTDALDEARELIDDEGRVPKHLRNAAEGHLSNFNISVGVSHDFMEALENDEEFTFTSPRTGEPHIATQETKELYDRFDLGEHVEVGEELSIPADEIWTRMVEGAYENGEPGVIYLDRVNDEHSFDVEEHPDHEILATNPCVTGDTLISTDNGLVPAEELYESGVATDIVVDGRLSDAKVKEASSVYKTGEKDVYRLTTEEGYEIRLTADHRVMTEDGWKEAGNLSEDDTVHIQNRKGEFGSHGTPAEGRVLGWLVGDGHLKHGEERAVLNFYDEDAEVSEGFAKDVNEVVREPTGNADYSIGVSEISRSDDYRGEGALEQRIRFARLYEVAEDAGLVEDKHAVPDAVMRGSEEMARGFLRALFTADGGVQGNVEKGVSVRLTSTDTELLRDVQRLLLNFGVFSKIYEDRHEAGSKELPDGKGGTKKYETQADHDLVISKDSLVRFKKEVGFLLNRKNEELDDRLAEYNRGPYADSFSATVESVEHDGHEAVYDLTEPDTHSFIGNGVVVHNCGEQPLEEYEACNLGHINLSTLVARDAPDWRDWYDAHADDYTTLEEAVDAFLKEAVDWEEFDRRIDTGTRFLENVVTMSDFPIDEIEEKVAEMRKIGLGIMGLAQMYVQVGIRYGSDEANEVARQVMTHINHESKRTSHELARERGVFDEWGKSKYANPTEYRDWFEKQTGESADDWEDGYPVRNHNTTTIAPTGTTSMLGNTTGGCEPIYNVAYYKNVSDDVQGDEMLVEFDDYFLRVLEANDIDIDAVKEEAEEQMSANKFDGVDGLDTVPDAIGELFVTTGDLSAKEHASVQCACQEGVDSAISKTTNAPHDSTVEDAKDVFEYIYRNGGKGVTYYRDGTRSKQVLTTRADNKESSDDTDPVEEVRGMLEEGEITVEELTDGVTGVDASDADTAEAEPSSAESNGTPDAHTAETNGSSEIPTRGDEFAPRPRPDTITGATQKVETGYGGLYVTINEDDSGMFEVFARIGKSGGYTASFTEAIARLTSLCLRSGIPPEQVVEQLEGIRSPKVTFDRGEQVHSVPDAMAKAMTRYMEGETRPQQARLPLTEEEEDEKQAESDGGVTTTDASSTATQEPETEAGPSDVQQIIDEGRNPECPECGSMLVYTEGCVKCNDCGFSEC